MGLALLWGVHWQAANPRHVSPVRVTAVVPPVNRKLSLFSGVQTGQGVPGVCVRGASAGRPAAQPLSVRALRAAEHRAAPPPAAAVAAGLPVQLPGNCRRGPQAKVGGTSHLQGQRFERRVPESLNGCSVTSSLWCLSCSTIREKYSDARLFALFFTYM